MNSTNNVTCNLEKWDFLAVSFVVPILQVLLNVVVAVAAIRGRAKLRNNYVYLYVVSMLTANIVFGLFAGYTIANRGFLIEKVELYFGDSPASLYQQRWWVLRNATVMSMFLVMSANVSSLIYGLRESSYFIGPGSATVARRKIKSRKSIRQKRNKAIGIVVGIWIVHLTFVVAASTGWNCLSQCKCENDKANWQDFCSREAGDGCSRILPPLTTSFLLVIASLWILLAVGIVAMLCTTIRTFVSTRKQESSNQSNVPQRADNTETAEMANTENGQVNPAGDNNVDEKVNICNLPSFNYTVKLMIWVAVLFLIFSVPTVIIIFLDLSLTHKLDPYVVTVSYVFALVYCILTPIILVVYMPRLKRAVTDLGRLCTCCTTTVIQRGMSTYSTTET